MVITKPDIIHDIIQRIQSAEAAGQCRLDAALARRVDLEARQLWGGSPIYVPLRNSVTRGESACRVQYAYLQGQRTDEIARKEGINIRTVQRILRK